MSLSLKIDKSLLGQSNILVLDKSYIKIKYSQISSGDEGTIFNYKDKYALKIFNDLRYGQGNLRRLNRKFKKVEAMLSLDDPSFCFPLDLIVNPFLSKIGYYMDIISLSADNIIDFESLKEEYKEKSDKTQLFNYFIQADQAIERIHKKDVIIGDIHSENVMIDMNNNVRFIDNDNYRYQDFDFDVLPWRANYLERCYNNQDNYIDNDIFSYALMIIEILVNESAPIDDDLVSEWAGLIINKLNISTEVRNGLHCIFSDSINKPYISEILKEINPKEKIFIRK